MFPLKLCNTVPGFFSKIGLFICSPEYIYKIENIKKQLCLLTYRYMSQVSILAEELLMAALSQHMLFD